MNKYRTEVYWWRGVIDVKIWKDDVFIVLTAETDFHPALTKFCKVFSACKAGKWNIYEISAADVAFLLANMKVTDSQDYRNQVFKFH